MVQPHRSSTRTRFRSRLIYWVPVLTISLLLIRIGGYPIEAYSTGLHSEKAVKSYAGAINSYLPDQKEEGAPQLEHGKPIERELAGGESHTYQIPLNAGNYVKLVVDQRGIDVSVSIFNPDGKPITEVNSEPRTEGAETVTWVAEEAGSYRVAVLGKYKNVAAGRYQIQVAELGIATESDRALSEALKLNTEFLRLFHAGKYDEARPLGERVLQIREKTLGPDHPDVARIVHNLGYLYYFKAEYTKAESYYQRALAIREKVLGPEHRDVAATLNNIGLIYSDIGEYDKAELVYQRALNIYHKTLGTEHPDVGTIITNIAKLYYEKGDYEKAEPLFKQAQAIFEKALGPEHPNVTVVLNNLATLYRRKGNNAKAEPIYLQILALRQKLRGPEHPSLATPLINLAMYYDDRGDYEKAEPLFQRALALREKALGLEHPDVARVLDNLADLYKEKEEYAKAEALSKRALSINEKVLGPAHIDVALALNNLAELYSEGKRDYAMAEPLFQRALGIVVKSAGPNFPGVADVLNNLANLYRKSGEFAKAEPLYKRALAIRENSLGQEHPEVAETLVNLARLHAAKGDYAQAVAILSRANAIDERNFPLQLAIGFSERQKLFYLSRFSEVTDFTLSLQSRAAANDAQAINLSFTTLLQRKGRGLDAMADTIATLRHHAPPDVKELLERLTRARSQLASLKLTDSGAGQPDIYRTRLKKLEEENEKVERELSSSSYAFRNQVQPVTLSAVQAALPSGSALLEFVYLTPQDLLSEKKLPPRYLAYLITTQGQPKWVDLGEARLIDRAIDAWRGALRNPGRKDVKRLARAVDERMMRPVRSLLSKMQGATEHLLIAPDGSLNLIPFAALVDERNRYLIERYAISYLTSGRDLLRLQTPEKSKSAPLVVANPDFGRLALMGEKMAEKIDLNSGKSQSEDQAQDRIDANRFIFQPLPGTEDEALAIKALIPNATIYRRKEATETALKEVTGPSILHIATHGFFFDYQDPARINSPGAAVPVLAQAKPRTAQLASTLRMSKNVVRVKDPLLRSGLALAGANEGKSGDDDGLLTALEAASLYLSGTKLVVLSACDTGVGEVMNGEGVKGLRRALVLAGSESQVMSLWPVSDEATKDLMIQYYKVLQQGEGRGEGLREVQLRMLRGSIKRQHPFYWAAFIQSGEWANLDGKRDPSDRAGQ
jgi:CHAT domain-containing protein/Tfp pilus assembly protein PilF